MLRHWEGLIAGGGAAYGPRRKGRANAVQKDAYTLLMEAIEAGVYKPGDRLVESELAERLEVSRQTVNALETGKYDPSLPLAFRIARLFGESIESLFIPED